MIKVWSVDCGALSVTTRSPDNPICKKPGTLEHIYMGMSILDYSKIHMYSFYLYCDVLKPKYQDNIKLVYTDTDRRKFRSQTSDNIQRWKSRGGKSQRGEVKK